MKKSLKKLLLTIAKFITFFIAWAVMVSVPLSIMEKPGLIAHSPALLRLYWELVPFAAVVLATVLFIRFIGKKHPKLTMSNKWGMDTLTGAGWGAVWLVGSVGLLMLLQVLSIGHQNPVPLLGVWALALFINTMTQELLIRGYLFSLVREKYNTIAAVVTTTILFTALHGPNLGPAGLGMLNVIAASILFSLVLIYTKGLWAPIVMHFVWNLLGGFVLSAIVLADDQPSMFAVSLKGSPLLVGGAAKVEGSIVTLSVSLLLIAVFGVLLYRKREHVRG